MEHESALINAWYSLLRKRLSGGLEQAFFQFLSAIKFPARANRVQHAHISRSFLAAESRNLYKRSLEWCEFRSERLKSEVCSPPSSVGSVRARRCWPLTVSSLVRLPETLYRTRWTAELWRSFSVGLRQRSPSCLFSRL